MIPVVLHFLSCIIRHQATELDNGEATPSRFVALVPHRQACILLASGSFVASFVLVYVPILIKAVRACPFLRSFL
jgi:hypothetical protein